MTDQPLKSAGKTLIRYARAVKRANVCPVDTAVKLDGPPDGERRLCEISVFAAFFLSKTEKEIKMRKTVIVCDRCGKETTLDNSMTFQGKLDVVNRTDESNMNQALFGGGCRSDHMETIEVCKECGDFIIGKVTYLVHDAIRFKSNSMEAHKK